MEKIEKDKADGTFVAVFKVNDLSSKKNRYKVDIHASQYHLTGVVVHSGHFSLVRHAHFLSVVGVFSEPLRDGFGWWGSHD